MANIFFSSVVLSLYFSSFLRRIEANGSDFQSDSVEDRPPQFRLNDTFIPSNYEIELKFPVEHVFDGIAEHQNGTRAEGKVKILGVNKVSRKSVSFHVTNMNVNIFNINVTRVKNPSDLINVKEVNNNKEGFMTVVLENELKAEEEIQLEMDFVVGIANCAVSVLSPFCSGKYETDSGETREFFLSHSKGFERIFPSFNEPHLRTTFDMTIVRRSEQKALFNTELVSSFPDPEGKGWMRDKFARTIPLPSSAIAVFLASHFSTAEAKFGNKTARVHLPDFSAQRLGINETASKVASILNIYEELLDTNRVAKMDLVVVPLQTIGWRITWGLTIYSTQLTSFATDFPYNVEVTRVSSKNEAIGHPLFPSEDGLDGFRETNRLTLILAQQYFASSMFNSGRTPYFTEPLQRFLKYIGWESLGEDIVGKEAAILWNIQLAFENDAYPPGEPISEEKQQSSFQVMPINGGGPLLRMIDNFLTRPTMTKALRIYLQNIDKNEDDTPKDFVDSLEEAAGADTRSLPAPMEKIIKTWFEQSGVPLVKVDMVNRTHISFSQQLLKYPCNMYEYAQQENKTWYIPVTYVTQDEPTRVNMIWLESDNSTKIVEHDVSKWILVNPNATGYFRTLYNKDLLQLLVPEMGKESIVNGMTTNLLLDDYAQFTRYCPNPTQSSFYATEQELFNLTRNLGGETHLGVWNSPTIINAFFPNGFFRHPRSLAISNYVESRVASVRSKIGNESSTEPPPMKILRKSLLKISCAIHGDSCAPYASKLFHEWKANSNSKVADGFECAIVSFGGQEAFDFVFQKYAESLKNSSQDSVRRSLRLALPCVTEPQIRQGYFNKTLEPQEFGVEANSLEFYEVFEDLYYHAFNTFRPEPSQDLTSFLTSHFKQAEEALGRSRIVDGIIRVVIGLGHRVSTREEMEDAKILVKLIEKRMGSDERKRVEQALKQMQDNISWMSRVGEDIITLASSS